jgi:hypothetical protein
MECENASITFAFERTNVAGSRFDAGRRGYALAVLAPVFAILLAISWQEWANLTIDGGREMNTPLRLLSGELLYRDVYYLYGPVAPYLNAALYAVFGSHLNTLYGAGTVASVLLLVLLFRLGETLTGGWAALLTTWMVLVLCVFKQDGNYIFPYTYSAVYGTVLGLGALAAQVRYIQGRQSRALTVSGILAGLALICKLEFGFAATASLIALAYSERSGGRLQVLIRGLWPALTIALLTYGMLLSRMSWDTLVKDTFLWPTYIPSELVYFNRAKLGLNDPAKTLRELLSALSMLGIAATVIMAASATGPGRSMRAMLRALPWRMSRRLLLVAGASVGVLLVNAAIFKTRWDVSPFRGLPVLCLGAIYCYARRHEGERDWDIQRRSLFVLSVYSLTVIARVILRVPSGGAYGSYLLPVPLLLFTHLATTFYRPVFAEFPIHAVRAKRTVLALFITGLTATTVVIAYRYSRNDYVPLDTARGTAKLARPEKSAFEDALEFVARTTQPREYVSAVPEGSSLNFLGDRPAPLRYEILTPGFLDADGERRAIEQLIAKDVKLVFLLNRPTREFGCPVFGRDCYRDLMRWIETNYEVTAVFGEGANAASQIGDKPFFIKGYRQRK